MPIEGESAYLFAVVYIPEFRFPILDSLSAHTSHHSSGRKTGDGWRAHYFDIKPPT